MNGKPRWRKSQRIDREMSFELKAKAEHIFPLLCPVREYEWIPDWSCEMIHSDSGLAEKDAIFSTPMTFGKKALWCCIVYEPPRLIEYLFVIGSGAVVRLSIRLTDAGGGATRVSWAMRFTLSPFFARHVGKVTSREGYDAMIGTRRRQLEEYFARRKA
jgi:hypothetical protein